MSKKSVQSRHPGVLLMSEYLEPQGLSLVALARAIGANQARLAEVATAKRAMSADLALRLSRFFGTDPRFWLNLQVAHDLAKAEADGDYTRIRPRAA